MVIGDYYEDAPFTNQPLPDREEEGEEMPEPTVDEFIEKSRAIFEDAAIGEVFLEVPEGVHNAWEFVFCNDVVGDPVLDGQWDIWEGFCDYSIDEIREVLEYHFAAFEEVALLVLEKYKEETNENEVLE